MKQGEIWTIRFSGEHDSERNMHYSAVIVNDDIIAVLPSRVVVPITDWQDKFDDALWLIKVNPNQINNLGKPSAVDAFQLHSIALTQFVTRIGTVSARDLGNIKKAVMAIISADS